MSNEIATVLDFWLNGIEQYIGEKEDEDGVAFDDALGTVILLELNGWFEQESPSRRVDEAFRQCKRFYNAPEVHAALSQSERRMATLAALRILSAELKVPPKDESADGQEFGEVISHQSPIKE